MSDTESEPVSDSYEPEFVWYTLGEHAPPHIAECMEVKLGMLEVIRENIPRVSGTSELKPVTWEEVDAYLRKEVVKPVGQRDLRRYFAFFVPLYNQLEGEKSQLILHEAKMVLETTPGEGFAYPAVDCPPWMLDGTPENATRVEFRSSSGRIRPNVVVTSM
ncbi:hypothetical protein BOTBODRAFT_37496 [Botryobasidium botryosum FD-172 SS1]|uniref:Uncharacterized protein n=1 Tax=Botryobasidium botryosum (strain FD-172 SS1) TaxID=930990 RepID=A0A067MBK5_BOTB1|nr:hypothetical protein BOTBODRAFT_37496 [Botryobasidium botryosum FD-172 SS1]